MYLQSLSLTNYKNYNQVELSLSPKMNCFVGQNGVGKTNLLDAVYYLSMCKSYLNPIDNQNIKYDQDFSVLQGNFILKDKKENIYISIDKQKKKRVKRNKKDYQKLSEHIGFLPVVMISPVDSNLILGGSEERRKYMDRVISQYDKDYLNALIKYNRALNQRNQLLKSFYEKRFFDTEALDLWDEQLIQLGSIIHKKRVEFTNELVPVFQFYYDMISAHSEKVELYYNSQLNNDDYRRLLTNALEKDRIVQHSTVGIHKDDLDLTLGNYPIKKAGSQGQQKTFLVALKLAQYDFIKKIKQFYPILLLDDIFDKFDQQRVEQVIKLVSNQDFGQIFISDTSKERLRQLLKKSSINYQLFKIESSGDITINHFNNEKEKYSET
ncbi:MAG: DNA replication/repair protein RecF [Bacteroidales bacterium]